MFTYTDFVKVLFKNISVVLTSLMGITLNENIVQYLPPNWIIDFLEAYLMCCSTVFPFSSVYNERRKSGH
jgi:hypothetical protein